MSMWREITLHDYCRFVHMRGHRAYCLACRQGFPFPHVTPRMRGVV